MITGIVGAALAMTIGQGAQNVNIAPGAMEIRGPEGKIVGFCPLKGTEVVADIVGMAARVNVVQTFTNTSASPIEAVYTFPLPADAAVDRMQMRIGERIVAGTIKRREEAERIYNDAKNQGRIASLLNQERPNIFTQSVANIMPGATIKVEIGYVQKIKFDEGEFEFNFPMVVGPRFLGNTPDASNISPPITPKGTRTGTDIKLKVNIDAGVPIAGLRSELHDVIVNNRSASKVNVELAKKNEIPNRDFILRYQVSGSQVQSGLVAYADQRNGGFFTLMLMPPKQPRPDDISAREMIFVMDQSGSQSGFPIEKSRELTLKMIDALGPNDTFNVLGFSNEVYSLWESPRPNNAINRAEAKGFVSKMEARGGTQLIRAVYGALKPKADPARPRIVLFNTDGFIGDEWSVLEAIQTFRANSRMFTFGIGNSVNRFLIDAMGAEGRGTAEYVTLAAESDPAVARFVKRLRNPLLMDVKVKFDGLEVADVLPAQIPDVFSEAPVILHGRYTKPGRGRVTISGSMGGELWSRTLNVTLPDLPGGSFNIESDLIEPDPELASIIGPVNENAPGQGSSIATLWARSMVDEVMRSDWIAMRSGAKESHARSRITRLGLAFNLMTQFTSFVAVEEKVVNKDGKSVRVRVPIEMADGVNHEGIFGGEVASKAGRPQNITLGANPAATAPVGLARGGGSGGAGFGGGAGGAVADDKGRTIAFISFDPSDNSIIVRDGTSNQERPFDKLSDEEVRWLWDSTYGDNRIKLIKGLTERQRQRLYLCGKVSKSIRESKKSDVDVMVVLSKVDENIRKKLEAAGLKIDFIDRNSSAIGTIAKTKLATLAQIEEVRTIENF